MLSRSLFKQAQLFALGRFPTASFSTDSVVNYPYPLFKLFQQGPAYDESIRTPIAQRPGISHARKVTLVPGVGIGPEVTSKPKFRKMMC